MAEESPREITRRLRSLFEGVLLGDDHAESVYFVLDPASGGPVAPVANWLLDENGAHEAADLVLMTPDENADSLQLLCRARAVRPDEFGGAYYEAHHAKPAEGTLCLLEVESIKAGLTLASGEDCCVPNPLVKVIGAICRAVNADRARLAEACDRALHVKPQAPICVGVDPDGLSIRARFGIVRIPFDIEPQNAEQALSLVADILARAGDRP